MNLHQFNYGLTGPQVSCEFPSACSEWSVSSDKFVGNSPDHSLHSRQLQWDNSSPLSNSLELHGSRETISVASHPRYSPLDTNNSLPEGIMRVRHTLEEIETVLMAPDTGEETPSSNTDLNKANDGRLTKRALSFEGRQESPTSSKFPTTCAGVHPEKRRRGMREDPQNNVRHLLIKCAEALSEDNINEFEMLVEEARSAVSISGDPVQRVGTYLIEGLVARHRSSGARICRALGCQEPGSNELLSYRRILYHICPYFKFGYMAANGAIAEALRNEDRIHIIDFQISQGTQWITLIQALAARPKGPPHVRITGIDDRTAGYDTRGEGLQFVGRMLSDMSEKFNIPLEFNGLPVNGPQVTREMLDIRPGEAVAVNFALQLHHTPDESVDVDNPRDGLLRMVKGLCPKVTTLVEHESNTNTAPFLPRFMETMDYYSGMFESIDVTLPRESKERINVEMHCLAKDMVNIIACEGKERVERHELLGKWRARLSMAGFKPYPLSSYVNSVIKKLLGYYSDNYTLVEKDGAILLGWKNRNLISASAWY
ncbi:chitin-inducible gibberellin-responsive protein 1-like [Typha angustifolia]|uniref:chitin-inducible gibberellin-responsive protein 1-like n=1 Tax=Typha angustifolia TaxID=59011 RepID=UPI003C2CF61D